MDAISIVSQSIDDDGVIHGILYDCVEPDKYIGTYVSVPHGGTHLLQHVRVHSHDELLEMHIRHAFHNMNQHDVQFSKPFSTTTLIEVNTILRLSKLCDLKSMSTIDMEDEVIQAFAIMFRMSHESAKIACTIRLCETTEEYGTVSYQLPSGSILHGIAKKSDIIEDNLHDGWWGIEGGSK